MKRLIFSLIAIISSLGSLYSQTFAPRTNGSYTPEDYRLAAKYNFYMPRLMDTTLMGGKDTLGCLIYVIPQAAVYIRDTMPGGHKWTKLLKSGDITGNTNSNIGSGFRFAVPGTNNIKTFFTDPTLSLDSTSNPNALTLKADTSSIRLGTRWADYNITQYNLNAQNFALQPMEPATLAFAADASCIRLNNGKILAVYGRTGTANDFNGYVFYSATIDSLNHVDTLGRLFPIGFITEASQFNGSLFRLPSGNIGMIFQGYNSASDVQLYFTQSANEGVTWSAPTQILTDATVGHLFLCYPDRVVRDISGNYYLPIAVNTDDDPSTVTGDWQGRYMKSSNGTTWVLQSTLINSVANDCIEPGMYESDVSINDAAGNSVKKMVYYWRSRQNTILYKDSAYDAVSFSSAIIAMGLETPNAPVTVKAYNKKLYASYNALLSNAGTGQETRNKLVFAISGTGENNFKTVATVFQNKNTDTITPFEPTLFIDTTNGSTLVFFSTIWTNLNYGDLLISRYNNNYTNTASDYDPALASLRVYGGKLLPAGSNDDYLTIYNKTAGISSGYLKLGNGISDQSAYIPYINSKTVSTASTGAQWYSRVGQDSYDSPYSAAFVINGLTNSGGSIVNQDIFAVLNNSATRFRVKANGGLAAPNLDSAGSPLNTLHVDASGNILKGPPIAGTAWGSITGTLSDQTDLQLALSDSMRVLQDFITPKRLKIQGFISDSIHTADAVSAIKLNDGRILAIYQAMDDPMDLSTSHFYYSLWDGKTWSTPVLLFPNGYIAYNNFSGPHLYRMPNGDIGLLFQGFNSITDNPFFFTKTANQSPPFTWDAASAFFSPSVYCLAAYDRVIRASDGKYYFPFSMNTNGIQDNQTGNYVGRYATSTNGSTWTVASTILTGGPDSLVSEPGIYETSENIQASYGYDTKKLVFYWRNRASTVLTRDSLFGDSGFDYVRSLGVSVPNSTVTIKYHTRRLYLVANKLPSTVSTQDAIRKQLSLWASDDNGQSFQSIANVDGNYDDSTAFHEGTLFFDDTTSQGNLYLFYSSIQKVSGISELYNKKYAASAINGAVQDFTPQFSTLNISGGQKVATGSNTRLFNIKQATTGFTPGHISMGSGSSSDKEFFPYIETKSNDANVGIGTEWVSLMGLDNAAGYYSSPFAFNGKSNAGGTINNAYLSVFANNNVGKFYIYPDGSIRPEAVDSTATPFNKSVVYWDSATHKFKRALFPSPWIINGSGNIYFPADVSTKFVGIGTVAPAYPIDVRVATTGTNGYSFMLADSNSSLGATMVFGWPLASGSGDRYKAFFVDGNGLNFGTLPNSLTGSPTAQLTMRNGGNFGIGTVTPSFKLSVIGSVGFDLGSDATGDVFYRGSGGNLVRLPIGSNGDVLTLASGLPSWSAPVTQASSAEYTATLTNGTNVASSSFVNAHYYRTGSFVNVWMQITIDPTSTGATSLGISLPFASTLSANDVMGQGNCTSVPAQTVTIGADTGNNRANLVYTATDNASQTFYINFSYKITPP